MRIRVSRVFLMTFMTLASFITIYPMAWVILQSFKTETEFLMSIWSLPSGINLDGYYNILFQQNLAQNFMNSVRVTIVTTVYNVFLISLGGYAFSKLRFKFKEFFFYFFIINLMIPAPILLLPMFLQVHRMGLINTLPALVLPYFQGMAPMGLILCRSYMSDIPNELSESARVDGCSPVGIYAKIIIPIARPILATLAILSAMGAWNEFNWALVSLTRTRFFTLPVRISALVEMGLGLGYVPLFAALTLSAMVIILIFFAMQRHFIDSITAGAVKG